jgi:DNA-binding beta-propeller fold protein YncE
MHISHYKFNLLALFFTVTCINTVNADSLYIGYGTIDGTSDTIKRYDFDGGNLIVADSIGAGTLHGPRGLLSDGNGNLLVSNQNVNLKISGNILKYTASADLLTEFVPSSDKNAPFSPRGIILDTLNGKLYVADLLSAGFRSKGRVRVYDANDGHFLSDLSLEKIKNKDYHPQALVFGTGVDVNGNTDGKTYLYVSTRDLQKDQLGGQVLRYNLDGSLDKIFIADEGGVEKLNRPSGLVFGPDGRLYITSFRADASDIDSIRIYQPDGTFWRKVNLNSPNTTRAFSQAILFGPDGCLFVPINTGEIRKYCGITTGTDDSYTSIGGDLGAGSPWYLTFGKTNPMTLKYPE